MKIFPDAYNYYPGFEKIKGIRVGNGFLEGVVFILGDEERTVLWRLMRIDDWAVAANLPARGFTAVFSIHEEAQI